MELQMNPKSPGAKFIQLVKESDPLIITGVINAYTALLAKQAKISAIYLSGAGVANADFGLPDLGMTSLTDVVTQVARITAVSDLPLLVDGDTGWGGELNVARTVQQLLRAGAAGVHFEDQAWPKRCGQRDGKQLIPQADMAAKITAAVAARAELELTTGGSPEFVIMARTDALGVESEASALARAQSYVVAGADMIFAEAVTELEQYQRFVAAVPGIPVLANITEFGKTPLFTAQELATVGIKMMLFPLSAWRAMNKAALEVFQTIQKQGSQQACIGQMQTRAELYDLIHYAEFERKISHE